MSSGMCSYKVVIDANPSWQLRLPELLGRNNVDGVNVERGGDRRQRCAVGDAQPMHHRQPSLPERQLAGGRVMRSK
jgi:hypothetical protein